MIIREIMMEKEVCKDFEAFSVFVVCFCNVEAGDFLPFSRGQISTPFQIENSHIFPQYQMSVKKSKNVFFFFFFFFFFRDHYF